MEPLHCQHNCILYIWCLLLKSILCKVGQSALLKHETPSALIWFISKLYFCYIIQWCVSWANVLCSNVSILDHLFYLFLNHHYPLPRLMVFKFGQWVLLRYLHPSAPILFPSEYSIPLHKSMARKLIQCALLKFKHPSTPILLCSVFDPLYII